MDEFEHYVAQQLAAIADSVPPGPAVGERVLDAGRGLRRRRGVTTISSVVVTSLVIVAAGFLLRGLPLNWGYRSGTSSPAAAALDYGTATAGAPTAPTTAASLPPCRVEDLQLHSAPRRAPGGVTGLLLIFTNVGATVCQLTGYPGVDGYVDPKGEPFNAYWVPFNALGGLTSSTQYPHPVALDPGQSASAALAAKEIPAAGSKVCPPSYTLLKVTPPNGNASIDLKVGLPSCQGLAVTPVVAGSTAIGTVGTVVPSPAGGAG